MIKAVIFDMDGLLIDSEPFWQQSEKEAFSTVGINLTKADMQHTMGVRIDEVVEYWYHRYPWSGPSQKDIEALILDKVIKHIKEEGVALPGVYELLDKFTGLKIPMTIASSSSNEIIEAVVEKLNIGKYLQHTYSAVHEPYGKPHPGVFISTANLLNTKPLECLVFEDSPSGVIAAKAAKMKCVAVPEPAFKNHPFIQAADEVLDSLVDFNDRILTS